MLIVTVCALKSKSAGFKGNTSEVRMAQYETEARAPKEPLIRQLSEMYGVSPRAIKVPDIDSELGLMHTLFALEDMYGFQIANIDGALCLHPVNTGSVSITMFDLFSKWYEQAKKVHKGEITKEEYDSWRYNFSDADLPGIHVKDTPSQELSDALIRMSKEEVED